MSTVTKVVARKPKRVKAQRVAAYCRVSTDTTKQGLSLENQEAHYQALIEAHENWNLVGIFHDDGISGTKMDKRQGLANLLTACEESRVDLVITKSISQLARNTTDCLHIVRKLKNLKIPIIFERENINTSSMDGELMLTVLSSLAQDESTSISKNIKLGIRHRAESGVYHHSFAPYGYRKVGKDLVIDPEQSQVVKRIFKRYNDGLSVEKIVNQLNADGIIPQRGKQWYGSTVRGMLKNPTFTGTLALGQTETNDRYNRVRHYDPDSWLLITNHHPAIVDQATFDQAQQTMRLKAGIRKKADYHQHYPFTKLITCAHCGSNFKRHKNGTASYWVCTKHLRDTKSCPITAVREEKITLAWLTMMNKLHFS